MPLSDADRRRMIDRYAEGPARLGEAIEAVPEEARKWRPGEDRWSAHEVVCHCADAEVTAAVRLRFLLCEVDPVVQGYDEAKWARELRYHDFPLEPSLEAVRAVRAHTAALLRTLRPDDWPRKGRHSVSGEWDVDRWLSIYSEHVHKHAGQIERNLAAWRQRGSPRS
jgi:hypothetical protein